MALIESFVRNPIKVSVAVLLVALFGTIALLRMPMQLTPEVQTPTLTVETVWPGASPQEVEREIVIEQEEQLKSVEGVTKMTSESMDSLGRITLEFQVGADIGASLLKVNSRLQQVPRYPEDADQPVISTSSSSNNPIAWFILSARRPSPEQLTAFGEKYPDLRTALKSVQSAHNVGVAMLRLRQLANTHSEFRELLPPADLDVAKLKRFAEDEIEARFERVSGVSQSNVIGGLRDEMQVVVDPERLALRQLTLSQVNATLRGQNSDVSAGDFWEGKRRWVVRSLGRFRSPEQVENQLLAVRDGAPVFVRDVASVRHDYKKPDGMVRRFGESTIAINCLRETGANVLDVMDGLRKTRQQIDEIILKPKGLELTQVYDETEYINSSVDLVQDNIFLGSALTVVVLMLFLNLSFRTLVAIPFILVTAWGAAFVSPWIFGLCLLIIVGTGIGFARGSLVTALAIPTSIIGTFLILGLLGRSLNVISLAGMAFAVGMLVDNAVVVLENIDRHRSLGLSVWRASIEGTHEVWGAVAASTLTTVAVFLPVIFVQQEAGQLFRDIAISISGAVALSLVVAMTVIPTAAAYLLDDDRSSRRVKPLADSASVLYAYESHSGSNASAVGEDSTQVAEPFLVRIIRQAGSSFVASIVAMNAWFHHSTGRRLAVVIVMIVGSLGLTYLMWPKVEYLPNGNRNLVFGILLPPPGYNLDELTRLGESVEAKLRPYWDLNSDTTQVLDDRYPPIADFFFVARGRQVFLGLRSLDPSRAAQLVGLIREVTAGIPGTFAVAKQSSLFEQGLAAGRTIDIEITGPELDQLVRLGAEVFGKVRAVVPSAQVRPVPSLDLSSPELHVEPRLLQAAELGVSSSDLGFTVNALVDGAYVGDYFHEGRKIDLTVIGENRYVEKTQDVETLPVAVPSGQLIPLGALADVSVDSGPEQINHRERVRAITIEVSPPPEMPLEVAMGLIQQNIVEPMNVPNQARGIRINLAGTSDKLRAAWDALQFNIILAVLITYLLMAALFESWVYPFVIILSVPLGAVGGVAALRLLNVFVLQPLDVLTMLGFVILIGTVVNNPILIVHQALTLMRLEGRDPVEAMLESVRTRIRPIFMTTITTVLGLFPLVVFPGAGSELYRGLGSVVLGGLLVSTLFSLLLVPALLGLMFDVANLVRGWLGMDVATLRRPDLADGPAPVVKI